MTDARISGEVRLLQSAVAVATLVPITAGLAGMLIGPRFADPSAAYSVSIDSHFRYLSGLLCGIGISFLVLVPRIRTATSTFRMLTAFVFLGGSARLLGLVLHGEPSSRMLFGLAMELAVTPLLCLWQARVSRL